MGTKDLSEKKLEDFNDVFADIMNVLVFECDYLDQNRLIAASTESVYKAEDGGLKAQYRDTAKYYEDAGIIISAYGMENQTSVDRDAVIRVMGYDYASYRKQTELGNRRYPVLTLVLNFSSQRWNKPTRLKDLLQIPEGMECYVQDYGIRVSDIAFLPDETIKKFTGTFRHIAHFFQKEINRTTVL